MPRASKPSIPVPSATPGMFNKLKRREAYFEEEQHLTDKVNPGELGYAQILNQKVQDKQPSVFGSMAPLPLPAVGSGWSSLGAVGSPQPQMQNGSMAQGRPTDMMSIVKQMYPMLRDTNFGLVNSPDANSDGNMMESWPAGETGNPDYPRPAALPIDQFGVQVFDQNTTPRDIAADVFSHNLVNSDPALKQDYEAFSKTFETPQGKTQLLRDYQWDQQNAHESRPMAEWAATTRIPAYFRGRVFSQWSDEDQKNMYTPEQLSILDRMSARVHGK